MKYRPPHHSLLLTLGCQLAGFGLGLALAPAGPLVYLSAHALCSAILARLLGLTIPWQLFNLALPLAVPEMLDLHLSAPLQTAAAALALLFIPTFWTRVPLYLTNRAAARAVAELLPRERPFTLLDAGCGFGGLVAFLARRFPQGRFVGVELNPLACAAAKLRFIKSPRVEIRFADFWKMDFAAFDAVYAFLAPPPMPAFGRKARTEMAKGSIVISNSFPLPYQAEETRPLAGRRQDALYVYRMPGPGHW